MTQSVNAPKVQFEDRPTTPIFTFAMILALIGVFVTCKMSRPDWWLAHNSFQLLSFNELVKAHDYSTLSLRVMTATFASWQILQMGMNIYFVWVFCKHVEGKLLQPIR
jgi:membrane associated rhomboid family serine protease